MRWTLYALYTLVRRTLHDTCGKMPQLDINQNGLHSTRNLNLLKTILVMKYISVGDKGAPVLLLAHGAGAPMDSDFMNIVSVGLADRGVRVVRFEFPYMQERRETGKKRPPDRQAVLLGCWQQAINDHDDIESLFIGGKSMGGRMATRYAADNSVSGVVCLGYPFHPAGKPDSLRIDHLSDVSSPMLVLQGERDKLGSREEVAQYSLPSRLALKWLPDGDHDLKPRVRSGYSHQQHLETAVRAIADFILRV